MMGYSANMMNECNGKSTRLCETTPEMIKYQASNGVKMLFYFYNLIIKEKSTVKLYFPK